RERQRRSASRYGTAGFGHHIAFQLAAFMSAIPLWPRHPDPTLGADAAAEIAAVRIAMSRMVRIEGAGGNFFRQKRAYVGAQSLALPRQADRIETEARGHRDATNGQNP